MLCAYLNNSLLMILNALLFIMIEHRILSNVSITVLIFLFLSD